MQLPLDWDIGIGIYHPITFTSTELKKPSANSNSPSRTVWHNVEVIYVMSIKEPQFKAAKLDFGAILLFTVRRYSPTCIENGLMEAHILKLHLQSHVRDMTVYCGQ